MKKIAILVLIVFAVSLFLAGLLIADTKDDFQAIKKAVKKKADYKPEKEVKWFKVLITDNRTKKARVKITLPIALFEVLFKQHKHWKIDRHDCDIDLAELFKELKKHGPMVFIEVYEDDETIKVWLE